MGTSPESRCHDSVRARISHSRSEISSETAENLFPRDRALKVANLRFLLLPADFRSSRFRFLFTSPPLLVLSFVVGSMSRDSVDPEKTDSSQAREPRPDGLVSRRLGATADA